MAWKTVLMKLGPRDLNHAAFAAAADLARRDGGQVLGLHAEDAVRAPPAVFGRLMSAQLLGEMRALQAERTKTLEGEFRAALAEAGISGEHRHVFGDPNDVLATASYYADLLVVDQIVAETPEDAVLGSVAEHLALTATCPMLFVPEGFHAPDRVGRHVAIAWKECREAARAMQASMPFLTRAERVLVCAVTPSEAEPQGVARLVDHLRRHGVEAETILRPTTGDGEAAVLLEMIGERDIDLLVMGAFGRSRFREMVLGGVTRHLFRNTSVPLLTAH